MNSSPLILNTTLWMGSKSSPLSWMFTISARAYLAGWESFSSSERFSLMFSQWAFAEAREWLPSPTRNKSPSELAALREASPFTMDSAMAEPSGMNVPLMWPEPSMRSVSYRGAMPSFSAMSKAFSIVRPLGSSMRIMIWGSSKGEFALILTLGGILERTVPSVALQMFLLPGSKLYPSRSIAAMRPFLEGWRDVDLSVRMNPVPRPWRIPSSR